MRTKTNSYAGNTRCFFCLIASDKWFQTYNTSHDGQAMHLRNLLYKEKPRKSIIKHRGKKNKKTITEAGQNVSHLGSSSCTHSGRKHKVSCEAYFPHQDPLSSSITQCSMDHLITQLFKARPQPTQQTFLQSQIPKDTRKYLIILGHSPEVSPHYCDAVGQTYSLLAM